MNALLSLKWNLVNQLNQKTWIKIWLSSDKLMRLKPYLNLLH